jgi:hypothetical protein
MVPGAAVVECVIAWRATISIGRHDIGRSAGSSKLVNHIYAYHREILAVLFSLVMQLSVQIWGLEKSPGRHA